ncbi:MAG: hypothetical protein FJ218_01150 [Ignavibacteria bacterium]|nr:hypothetical protein [Ignavibacteria bacterium]
MLVKQNGNSSLGTIGGGCMEGEVLLHAQRLFETNKAEILTFHLNEDDIEHGLICGGSLDVFLEPISCKQIILFKKILSMQNNGNDCILATLLSNEGKIIFKNIVPNSSGSSNVLEKWRSELALFSVPTPHSLKKEIEKVFRRNETHRIKTETGEWILEPIQGTPQLIIFGGGHVSKYISKTAAMCGFHVSIIDDREKFANVERFPEAKKVFTLDFENGFKKIAVKKSSYIVIVTRGHQYDETVLEQALKTNVSYVGMIGSKRKVLVTFEHLLSKGISLEQLKRVYSPIGIEIGATTVEEIAVSVVAELIRVRKGKRFPLQHKLQMMEDTFVHLQK